MQSARRFKPVGARLCGMGVAVWVGLLVTTASAASLIPSLQGQYPVGCSNVEQDFNLMAAGASGSDYWEGNPVNGQTHYVTELLKQPDQALTYTVKVPLRSEIDVFEKQGGRDLPHLAITCYPTTAENTRSNYTLPTGAVVPRMQRGAEQPLFASNPEATDGKWPLLVLSHGMGGSPLGGDYLQVMQRLAAEGYVVYAPFHADARFSRIKINDMSDVWYIISKYAEIAEMMAIRPLGLKYGLDDLLSRAAYLDHIDTDRIAGFGASLGGMAMMVVQGAKLTTSWGGTERAIIRDNRYKAVVGYVPFSGYEPQAIFGDGSNSVKSVRVPYLGIAGTADIVAPLSRTQQMVGKLAGARYLISIEGMEHGFRVEDAPEVFGWTFAFLKAHLSRNQADRELFATIKEIPGGSVDRQLISRTLGWGSRDELEVVEYRSPESGKYFMTGRPNEIELLDGIPNIWARTGQRYAAFRLDAPLGDEMCRFWAHDGGTLNTHFYSTNPADCSLIRAQPWADDEGMVMRAASASACPDGTSGIVRFYNTRTVNHRYVTHEEAVEFVKQPDAADWVNEDVVFCAAKYSE